MTGDGQVDGDDEDAIAAAIGQALSSAGDKHATFYSSRGKDEYGLAPYLTTGLCDVGHQGKLIDKEYGLIYNDARYRHPMLARWMSPDPLDYPDGMNRFEPYRSNPITGLDPRGLWTEEGMKQEFQQRYGKKGQALLALMYGEDFRIEKREYGWAWLEFLHDWQVHHQEKVISLPPSWWDPLPDDSDAQAADQLYDALSDTWGKWLGQLGKVATELSGATDLRTYLWCQDNLRRNNAPANSGPKAIAQIMIGERKRAQAGIARGFSLLQAEFEDEVIWAAVGIIGAKTVGVAADMLDNFRDARKAAKAVDKMEDLADAQRLRLPTCFVAGTVVLTQSGPRPIEQISEGEKVWAYDHSREEWRLCEVLRLLTHDYEGDIITITVADTKIEATGNHPFWVLDGQGLGARPISEDVPACDRHENGKGRWVSARDLRIDDRLISLTSPQVVVSDISGVSKKTKVFNISVARLRTYAVGPRGLLVHNKPQPVRRVLQRGHTIRRSTARALGLKKYQVGRAVEQLKKTKGLQSSFHGMIMSDGSFIHPGTGEVLGNLLDYIE